jgi:hypothetical protein
MYLAKRRTVVSLVVSKVVCDPVGLVLGLSHEPWRLAGLGCVYSREGIGCFNAVAGVFVQSALLVKTQEQAQCNLRPLDIVMRGRAPV